MGKAADNGCSMCPKAIAPILDSTHQKRAVMTLPLKFIGIPLNEES
jgi:hypothetical protein